MDIRIFPPEEMIEATVRLPLSKSICNRLLTINALTPGAIPMDVIADCDDSRVLAEAISARRSTDSPLTIDVGAAGTAMRFATAWLSTLDGIETLIDGSQRMRQRPIGVLVDALRQLGADIEYTGEEGFPPLRIKGRKLRGGSLKIDATVSSQFISALMMIAPAMDQGLTLKLLGEPVSTPYIRMTAALMQRAGADVETTRYDIEVSPGAYHSVIQPIEPDWSAASYWYSITAISAGFVTLPGLSTDSLQGDSRCIPYFAQLGVATSRSEETPDALEISPSPDQYSRFEEDLCETPDIAQTLAVTAATLGIPFHLKGLASLRVKETDRLAAMKTELDKLGIIAEIRNGSELVWNGERHPVFEMPRISTYDDHRMAMAFAPVAVFVPGIIIENAEVVSKSYPHFWDDLQEAGFRIVDASIPLEQLAGEEEAE